MSTDIHASRVERYVGVAWPAIEVASVYADFRHVERSHQRLADGTLVGFTTPIVHPEEQMQRDPTPPKPRATTSTSSSTVTSTTSSSSSTTLRAHGQDADCERQKCCACDGSVVINQQVPSTKAEPECEKNCEYQRISAHSAHAIPRIRPSRALARSNCTRQVSSRLRRATSMPLTGSLKGGR